MTRKKVILTLSRVFPQTHSKKGINTLFAVNLFAGRKIHTIRTDEKELWEQRVKDINEGRKLLCVRDKELCASRTATHHNDLWSR